MKHSFADKMVASFLAIALVIWSTGCSMNTIASSLWDAEGKTILVRTTDGSNYELHHWKTDPIGNIEGQGRRLHPSGHPSLTGEYRGTIPVGSVESVQYIATTEDSKTETVVVISAIVFFSLLATIVANDGPRISALGSIN